MASKSGVCCPKFDVGGQAVMEGVMMRSPERTAVVVRQENGKIVARVKPNKQLSKKYKILGWPIIRGVVNFIMMMVLGVQTLTESAEMAGMEVEEPSEFEKKMAKTLVKSVEDVMMVLAVVFMAVKPLLFALTPSLGWVLAAQPIQMLGYGLFTPASVYYANENVSAADRVQGQTVMMVASNGLGSMTGNLLSGYAIDLGGVNAMLALCTVFGVLGILCAGMSARAAGKRR